MERKKYRRRSATEERKAITNYLADKAEIFEARMKAAEPDSKEYWMFFGMTLGVALEGCRVGNRVHRKGPEATKGWL